MPNNRYLVTIEDNKTSNPGQFLIGSLFYDKVKKYISLKPKDEFTERFFIQYKNGKCTHQHIGINTIREIPKKIACYLGLETPKRYTGHCLRRTATTLLSESGANMQQIKELGRWRSDAIAQLYIQKSIRSKELIYKGIVHQSKPNDVISIPSTSSAPTIMRPNDSAFTVNELDLGDVDFSEEFTNESKKKKE